ncbi:MAG TPA: L-2-amino-thiazoline-4-carboxylic acid hydrolase [Opitutaceae bacterium]|nr:L-2-amino-thiazoline-4-carboxylic acid hydrolase [Opitutaceae bacterium]
MSYEQVFNFAFRDHSIPYLLALADRIGREQLVEMLRSATDRLPFQEGLARQFYRNLPADFLAHVLVQETLEDTGTVRVQKVTRCLWAETYRAAGAADIGYAMWCYNDCVSARLRHEKLERNQTLMQGDECCLMKVTKETGPSLPRG